MPLGHIRVYPCPHCGQKIGLAEGHCLHCHQNVRVHPATRAYELTLGTPQYKSTDR